MREKVVLHQDPKEVAYDGDRFDILRDLRTRASGIQEALGITSYVYGSVARGDVRHTSDIDIIVLGPVRSFEIEVALERAGLAWASREIVKANPNSVPKGHIYIDDATAISFFMGPSTISEEEFYRFGGLVESGRPVDDRVPGVDKRLLFIEPTEKGHTEWSILDREAEMAKRLGIGVDTVEERVRVLTRRDKVGRTGVYLKRNLQEGEGFEEVLKDMMDRDPVIRRHAKRKK